MHLDQAAFLFVVAGGLENGCYPINWDEDNVLLAGRDKSLARRKNQFYHPWCVNIATEKKA